MKTFIKEVIKKIPILNTIGRNFLVARRKRLFLKDPNNLKNYNLLSTYLKGKDKENVAGNPALRKLHKELEVYRLGQVDSWNSFVYCNGYYYQGYHKIGINGIKPTEPRMENYDVYDYFNAEGKVLDIGANSGFLACYLTDYYKEVVGIELNPYLIKMGNAVKNHYDLKNIRFIEGDFIKYKFEEKFDAVFSLSNHFTIDGNLNMGFEEYVKSVYNIMNDKGVLFFESHNVNGDDSDMEEKFKIASKYFTFEKYKMVKAFYPADIDKLFAILIKKDTVSEVPDDLSFDLEVAKTQYSFVNM